MHCSQVSDTSIIAAITELIVSLVDNILHEAEPATQRHVSLIHTCLTRGLPGENFLLVMAGFPIPIFGVKGMRVVVGSTLLWSPSEGSIWGSSLEDSPRARREEWEGEETISTNLSTDVLSGFSSEYRLANDRLGLFSGVVSIASDELEAGGLTVSARLW